MFANLCLTTTKTATADWCQNINKWAELLFITILRREINVCLMMPNTKDEILMKYEWNIQILVDVYICCALAAILYRSRVQTAYTSSSTLSSLPSPPPTPSTLSTLCWRRTFVKHATDKSTLTCSICACAIASRQDKLGVMGGRGATAEWQKSRGEEGKEMGGGADCVASGLATATRRMIDDAKVHKLPKRNTNKMN